MVARLLFIVFALYCIASVPVFGQKQQVSQSNNFKFSTFQDPENSFQVGSLPFEQFETVNGSSFNFGFYIGTVWLKIDANHLTEQAVIELRNSNLDIIDFYVKKQEKYFLIESSGDHYKFNHRKIKSRFFQFQPKGGTEILIRIQNFGDQLFVPVKIYDQKEVSNKDYSEQIIFGIYYGLCLFAFFLNVFLFLKIRERSNLFYSLYLIGIVALQLALDGHGYQYIWSESIFFAKHAPPFLASFSILFLLLFSQSFLNTKLLTPKFNKSFSLIAGLVFINLFLSLIPNTYWLAVLLINVLTLGLNILIIPVAFFALKQNFKPAKFFLTAFILLILSVFVFVMRNFGILESNLLTDYCLQIGSTAEVILLSFAIVDKFNSYKEEAVTRLEEINQIQFEQNLKLEAKVIERTEQITEQKDLLQKKNSEIIDSINYAKRIQSALIPSQEEFKQFLPESFVFWEPKDIVSGDFYWVSKVQTEIEGKEVQLTTFCVGDCTGHGVPGAIISVLGLKILNMTVKNSDINSTAEALEYLDQEFAKTFHVNDSGQMIQDGMDIAFCALDRDNKKLYFSGAKNGMYIIRGNELIEIKGDKRAIGSNYSIEPFQQHVIDVVEGDLIVLYSDGYADQFGGERGKKFKYLPLKNLLQKNAHLPMQEQLTDLKKVFFDWKGSIEQTDDVCIVGVRV